MSCVFYLPRCCCYFCLLAPGLVVVVGQVLVPQAGTRLVLLFLGLCIYIPLAIYLRSPVHSTAVELSAVCFT